MAGLLGPLAAGEPDIKREPDASGRVRYQVGDRVFAEEDGETVRLWLRPEVGAAAVRTPGVRPEPDSWVRLEVAPGDRFARDRAEAWFRLALSDARGLQRSDPDRPR
jgi:hypothetical protein